MDIHDIALKLFTELVGASHGTPMDATARQELGREAYRCADAFLAAKDAYIRELPVAQPDVGF